MEQLTKTTINQDNYTATYCPEDNKLRLYTGWIEREEYLKLHKAGWKSTPKQDCDFVAVWTMSRENTAIEYAGYIGDEDQSPEERSADRAERFAMYRDKRYNESMESIEVYENSPSVYGSQNEKKAAAQARKRDRIGNYANNQWSKAEYWTERTEGVIHHALYKLKPSVRMGRIKILEKEERQCLKSISEHNTYIKMWEDLHTIEDQEKQKRYLSHLCDSTWHEYTFNGKTQTLYNFFREDLPLEDLRNLYLSNHSKIEGETRTLQHIKLRLAYERKMLKASGGLAGEIEMVPGGKLGSYMIMKVNKSNVSGRVVSVHLLVDKIDSWTYKTRNIPGTKYALSQITVEKMGKAAYHEPTEESLKELEEINKEIKATKTKKKTISLINPTIEEAKRVQKMWNDYTNKRYISHKTDYSSEIIEMTQAQYSARSKGSYTPYFTKNIGVNGFQVHVGYKGPDQETLFKLRLTSGSGSNSLYSPYRIIVITDKPQKKLPEFVTETAEVK